MWRSRLGATCARSERGGAGLKGLGWWLIHTNLGRLFMTAQGWTAAEGSNGSRVLTRNRIISIRALPAAGHTEAPSGTGSGLTRACLLSGGPDRSIWKNNVPSCSDPSHYGRNDYVLRKLGWMGILILHALQELNWRGPGLSLAALHACGCVISRSEFSTFMLWAARAGTCVYNVWMCHSQKEDTLI